MKKTTLFAVFTFGGAALFSSQVGINNTSPKATLDITAKTSNGTRPEGFIAPRLTGDEIKAADAQYTADQRGVLIYATAAVTSGSAKTASITAEGYYYFDGSVWRKVGSNGTDNFWKTTGNASTDPGINFLGTTDDKDLIIRRNSSPGGWIGTNNTGFGNYSFRDVNTTGADNTGVGRNALNINTSGSRNTAVGSGAIEGMSSFNDNTAIGYKALAGPFDVGSSQNTAVGSLSGSGIVYGENNTLLGYKSGNNLTIGSNNIVIGTGKKAISSDSNNTLNIGDVLFAADLSTDIDVNPVTPKGRVGIGTTTPDASAQLELKSTKQGFLPPRMNKTQRNGISSPATGLIVYTTDGDDSGAGCLQVNTGTPAAPSWQCLGAAAAPNVVVSSAAFNGTYTVGAAMTLSNTFTVVVTNNSFSNATMAFSTSDLVLSGVSGLTVSGVSPASGALAPGANVTVTYSLSVTPSEGTLTGTWNKISLNAVRTMKIAPSVSCSAGTWSNTNSPVSLLNGKSITGTYVVFYSGGNGYTFPSESYTTDGITLSLTGFTSSSSNGNLLYNVSGTYTGTTGQITFTTTTGCTIKLTSFGSCKKILDAYPGIASAKYLLDPDGLANTFAPMKAECDMATDGGGWTLVGNYTKTGVRAYDTNNRSLLPVIVGGIGTNETSANTSSYGLASLALRKLLITSDLRNQTASSANMIHLKFSGAAAVNGFKNGTATSSTAVTLTGHNPTFNFPGPYTGFNGDGIYGAQAGYYYVGGNCGGNSVGVNNRSTNPTLVINIVDEVWYAPGCNGTDYTSGPKDGYYRIWVR